MKFRGKTLSKFEPDVLNEDAITVRQNRMAVSDGAGGGGVFAERWSSYLVTHLPEDPIESYEAFDAWIDGIWEEFYNTQELEAKRIGGLFLKKFYDEGSFATLASVWKVQNQIQWMTYGDSVVFLYNRKTHILKYTFTELSDFAQAPSLINWKDPCDKNGFHSGTFDIDKDSIVMIASDTLSQYILMMYLYCQKEFTVLEKTANGFTKLSNTVKTLLQLPIDSMPDFEKDVLNPLTRAVCYSYFPYYLQKLYSSHLLNHDDYSLAICGNTLFQMNRARNS